MGWKAVRDHYKVGEYTIKVRDGHYYIGTPHVPDMIVFDQEGNVLRRETLSRESEFTRLLADLEADREKLATLIRQEDTFTKSIQVFSYTNGMIIEHFCEKLGWPNLTHTGEMMYENNFSTDRDKVVEWALEDAEIGLDWSKKRIAQLSSELTKEAERRDTLTSRIQELKALQTAQ